MPGLADAVRSIAMVAGTVLLVLALLVGLVYTAVFVVWEPVLQ